MGRITSWGFQSREKAETLSRMADREGTRQRRGQRIHYPKPIFEGQQIVQIYPFSGSPTVGDLVSPNGYGYHEGRLRFYYTASSSSIGGRCWVRLGDWDDNDGGQVIGTSGRYYIGTPIGNITAGGVEHPAYYVTVGDMQFIGKPDSNIAEGASGTVSVYHRSTPVDSGINLTCYAAGAAVTSGKLCFITRPHNGVLYVSPWKC